MTIRQKIDNACDLIRQHTRIEPEVGIVLGTGLGGLAEKIKDAVAISYNDIPGFVTSTVECHAGRLLLGTISGKPVVVMQGRFHYYEGYTMQEITFPIRVMHALGAQTLIISNAAGGMNPSFQKGDLVLIDDHINLLGDNPLIGLREPELGPTFPDMSRPYSVRLMDIARESASQIGIVLQEGVYVAVSGPSLETRAEYRFLRMLGADMVGMSTVPENIVANQIGMDVLGITIVSDLCDPDNLIPVGIEEIIETCNGAEPNLTTLVENTIAKI